MNRQLTQIVMVFTWSLLGSGLLAQPHHPHKNHADQPAHEQGATAKDTRILVQYPNELRQHTLSSMRAHLVALHDIQNALADGDFDHAAAVAESNLGMSSLHDHKASENALYMPAPMAQLGSDMHRKASQFALIARDAAVSGELQKPLKALSALSATCIACHAAYRLQ